MNRATGAAIVSVLVVLIVARNRGGRDEADARATLPTTTASSPATPSQGLLYGRVTTDDGSTYEGRLRFGGDEEAFWGHQFNGVKDGNPWAARAPAEQLQAGRSIEIFGLELPFGKRQIDLGRPMMARFGDIARIDAPGRDLRVTLKSGTVFQLQRFAADDFADGLRVWDVERGVVDLNEWRVRSVEFLPTPELLVEPDRLYGTVRTREGDFTGFIQWDREASQGSDSLTGQTADGLQSLRFDAIRSVERRSPDASLVRLRDGRTVELSNSRESGHRGIYVDDTRYGRVLVSWDAFDRLDFLTAGSGPAYADFPPGLPITGTVTTRDGRALSGRLVYDLDESETTETLDAPSGGIDYMIPFGKIARVSRVDGDERGGPLVTVTLHDGEVLRLERTGDLAESNAGILIFVDGSERPEYVQWTEVDRIDFERLPAT
jgi:hypothetical protein